MSLWKRSMNLWCSSEMWTWRDLRLLSETGTDGQHGNVRWSFWCNPPGLDLPLQHKHPALRRLPKARGHRNVPEVQSPSGEQTWEQTSLSLPAQEQLLEVFLSKSLILVIHLQNLTPKTLMFFWRETLKQALAFVFWEEKVHNSQ